MKERIEYIDIGKGCAILLMVMGHIIAWEYPKEFIQDSGLPAYNFSLYHFIYAFHMSLFFFFSGFVFKLRTVDFKGFESCVKKRLVTLMLPFLTFGCLYYLVYGCNFTNYWYLRSLFLFCFVNGIIELCARNHHTTRIRIISYAVIFIVFRIACHFLSNRPWYTLMGLDSFSLFYYPSFCLGFLASRYKRVDSILDNQILYTSGILIFLILFINKMGDNFLYLPNVLYGILNMYALPCCGVIVGRYFLKNSTIPKYISTFLQYLGRNTLIIYLLHFYLCISLPNLGNYSLMLCKYGVPSSCVSSFVIQFVITLLVAIAISILSILVASIFRRSRFLNLILFGKSK